MLTAREAAKMLGISARAVYELAAGGFLPHFRPTARAVRFDPADVEAYGIASGLIKPLLSRRTLRECARLWRRIPEEDRPPCPLTPNELAIADSRHRRERMAPWANGETIKALYEEAQRLSLETGVQHHVDHVIPLQGEFVSGLHVETNMQILPYRENIAKKNRFEPC